MKIMKYALKQNLNRKIKYDVTKKKYDAIKEIKIKQNKIK